ncbi:MAG: pyrroline-5-carboxylate reductase [Clostridiales bacterium]|nr:pyrroline-5-carboxylate reductase [Clostridiales bacterium]
MKIGFIGGGNMGGAIIGGMISSGKYKAEDISAVDLFKENVERLVSEYGIKDGGNNKEIAGDSDILFLSIKPNVYGEVIREIKEDLKDGCIVVSIAAGQSINAVSELFGREIKIVRVMPNTPALVGEGMAAVCGNEAVSEKEIKEIADIFNCFGIAEIVPEKMMDIVTAVSGSSPSFVYMFIEAMADAAVLGGMPRKQAYKFAAQTVLGSAKMVLDTGKHPGELKDMVCSPAGTTIEAVAELERLGMRTAVIEAIRVCEKKSKAMGKK